MSRNRKNKKYQLDSKKTIDEIKQDKNHKVNNNRLTQFAQNPSFIIITLIVSIIGAFGGYPAIKEWISKPEFNFVGATVFTMDEVQNNMLKGKGILIAGTMINNSEKPLFIENIDLKVTFDNGKEIYPSREVFPRNSVSKDDSFKVNFNEIVKSDLQKVAELHPFESISGSLFFMAQIDNSFKDDNIVYQLICTDIDGKKYRAIIKTNINHYTKPSYFPKSGVMINSPDTI